MKKPILAVTSHFIEPVEARIEREYEVRRKADGTWFTRDELLAAADGADAILITPFDRLDADFFERVPRSVKVISTYSDGVDHIDLHAASQERQPSLVGRLQARLSGFWGWGASDRLLRSAQEPLG